MMRFPHGVAVAAPLLLSPDLVRTVTTDLGALLALALLATLWLVVQRAWRSLLPEHAADDEARDVGWGSCCGRSGTPACGCAAGACRRETELPLTMRTEPGRRRPRRADHDNLTSPPTEIRR